MDTSGPLIVKSLKTKEVKIVHIKTCTVSPIASSPVDAPATILTFVCMFGAGARICKMNCKIIVACARICKIVVICFHMAYNSDMSVLWPLIRISKTHPK